ncbi:trypsin-like serine peptidase [Glycomyces buryatensis]|uniref:Trypsin-like serine protease n=1 Tax=Glycomyces buryatensis TaxID=2570927 RepID=A0A4S8QB12_9ACTN|nr:hypothetical protein [Glycomyces buryatensis]THV41528.1 hypothetical protein FAB82_10480 [Glycomyces buryatensis]
MQRNNIQRSMRAALACLAALVAALAFLASPASAAPEAPSGTAEGTTGQTSAPSGQVADLDAHWTAERMAAAEPADVGEPAIEPETAPRPESTPDADTARIAEPTAPDADFGASQIDHSYATGRLFFDDPEGDPSWCSASSIVSDNQSLVLTVGHCLHTGGGDEDDWSANVIFVPGYDDGAEPRGRWDGRIGTLTVFSSWYDEDDDYDDGGNPERDLGMLLVEPNDSGQNLTEVTGGHGFATGQGYEQDMHIIGYPENHENNEIQWHCWGETYDVGWFDSRIEIGCDLSHGASGGPWLLEYSDDITGLGMANGATSTITDDMDANRSSYFDDSTWDFYNEMSTS